MHACIAIHHFILKMYLSSLNGKVACTKSYYPCQTAVSTCNDLIFRAISYIDVLVHVQITLYSMQCSEDAYTDSIRVGPPSNLITKSQTGGHEMNNRRELC
ncbi:hypothetical protein V6Z11_D12G082600 [Gossypium hirsutum]